MLAAFPVAYLIEGGVLLNTPAAPSVVPGADLPFEVCYYNAAWQPPSADAEATHLQSDPRYQGTSAEQSQAERVHVELGPFRSASALGDFIELSGLWTDPDVLNAGCSAVLNGRAELWALELRLDRFEQHGGDIFAVLLPAGSGVEVAQVPLPPNAQALHMIDASGNRLAQDVSLTAQ
ncbi:MAG: hypothetical protein JO247_02200 [Chloroflexi bacterium]|nr:hypothetical protein [Chloroflexota bacterium]